MPLRWGEALKELKDMGLRCILSHVPWPGCICRCATAGLSTSIFIRYRAMSASSNPTLHTTRTRSSRRCACASDCPRRSSTARCPGAKALHANHPQGDPGILSRSRASRLLAPCRHYPCRASPAAGPHLAPPFNRSKGLKDHLRRQFNSTHRRFESLCLHQLNRPCLLCCLLCSFSLIQAALPDTWRDEFMPEGDAKAIEQHFRFNNGTEPATLDPQLMTGVPEGRLALAMFSGLGAQHQTLQPVPDLAESWSISETASPPSSCARA